MMLSKNSSVSVRNAWRSSLSKFGKSPGVGMWLLQVAQHQPLAGEVVDQRARLRIREHPLHLPLEHRRLAQLPASRPRQQLVVRDRAPQEERQPRRQLEVADTRPWPAPPAAAPRCGTGTSGSRGSAAAPARCRRRTMPFCRPAAYMLDDRRHVVGGRPAGDRRAAPASTRIVRAQAASSAAPAPGVHVKMRAAARRVARAGRR